MSTREQIKDNELGNVSGGQITYTWDGNQGSIGINGYNNFILLNKDAFGAYYAKHKDEMTEKDILKNLLSLGIIARP